MYYNVLQCITMYYNVLQCITMYYNVLPFKGVNSIKVLWQNKYLFWCNNIFYKLLSYSMNPIFKNFKMAFFTQRNFQRYYFQIFQNVKKKINF